MLRSMYSGVSGLRNHQTRLDTIGNNVANVNTAGFKGDRVTFQDAFNQTLEAASAPNERGGTNPQQVGLGMNIGSMDTIHTQGSLENTGRDTDLAIEGDGFFVVNDGQSDMFTRVGNFGVDSEGNLVSQGTGYKVQGYAYDEDADEINTDEIVDMEIPLGDVVDPEATENVKYNGNLNSNTEPGETVSTTVNVFDNLGSEHTLNLEFEESGENEWQMTVRKDGILIEDEIQVSFSDDGELTSVGDEGTSYSINDFEATVQDFGGLSDSAKEDLGFDIDDDNGHDEDNIQGMLMRNDVQAGNAEAEDVAALAIEVEGRYEWYHPDDINFDSLEEGDYSPDVDPIFTQDQEPQNDEEVDLLNAPGGIEFDLGDVRQVAGESTVEGVAEDGQAQGELETYEVDSAGIITGTYTNGETRQLGQVVLSDFTNPGGLEKLGSGLYQPTRNSGEPSYGIAGTGGRGEIAPGALEMSNVDMGEQFTDMIVTQRGFQANSRSITTGDEVLQELVNLKT
ncbi:flagellar hook protein FlgE [Natranaerobius thermophilus]|uniref:Flagellar hook protein FlgE n=2 Tax=Natranaerobius TaxID=375928 RepID=B2A353_NATTJ|nr:flagellar hook protein FlgE [Natranaerobius thermophilus]ACB84983.1 protein of unknown function DUF1078 domain protein [Natranaerobius thermophilus JW/NM-WN-LF]